MIGILAATPAGPAASGAGAWMVAAAVVAAAGALHWGLRRLERRLPLWLARRSPGSATRSRTLPPALRLFLLALKTALWIGVALFLGRLFEPLSRWLAKVEWWLFESLSAVVFHGPDRAYTVLDLLALPMLLIGVWLAISTLTGLVRLQLQRSLGLEHGVYESLVSLVRYVLLFLGSIMVLQLWGIDVSSLTIAASVLGVGIGFGLQNIASNFISGILLGLERPIKPGDFVNVGTLLGTVERIGARSTEIRTLDQVSILVPNSRFLENEVINWSHGNPVSRLHQKVGVAYGSEVRRVVQALLEAARGHPQVLRDPAPRVHFLGFGDSALDFELLYWIHDPREQEKLRSDLYFRIEASLRRHGIEIPFPQRDLHLKTPEIGPVVRAWSRRHFSDEELREKPSEAVPTTPLPALPPELGATTVDEERLRELRDRLRGPGGVEIRDRRHLLTTYHACFIGREAVDWLVRHEGPSREEALRLGQALLEHGYIRHVLDEHGFHDGRYFYHFLDDPAAD